MWSATTRGRCVQCTPPAVDLAGDAVDLADLNLLFVVNQVQYVNLRTRSAHMVDRAVRFARGQHFLLGELVTALTLVLGWRAELVPGITTFAFAPILLRGFGFCESLPPPTSIALVLANCCTLRSSSCS